MSDSPIFDKLAGEYAAVCRDYESISKFTVPEFTWGPHFEADEHGVVEDLSVAKPALPKRVAPWLNSPKPDPMFAAKLRTFAQSMSEGAARVGRSFVDFNKRFNVQDHIETQKAIEEAALRLTGIEQKPDGSATVAVEGPLDLDQLEMVTFLKGEMRTMIEEEPAPEVSGRYTYRFDAEKVHTDMTGCLAELVNQVGDEFIKQYPRHIPVGVSTTDDYLDSLTKIVFVEGVPRTGQDDREVYKNLLNLLTAWHPVPTVSKPKLVELKTEKIPETLAQRQLKLYQSISDTLDVYPPLRVVGDGYEVSPPDNHNRFVAAVVAMSEYGKSGTQTDESVNAAPNGKQEHTDEE